jgi:hypothetical protein
MTKRRTYKWRYTKSVLKRLLRNTRQNALVGKLRAVDPQLVYGGLIAYAQPRRKANGEPWNAPGWAKHAFVEIFGSWPRNQDHRANPATPDWLIGLIAEWAAGRKRPRRVPLFERRELSAPNGDRP